MTRLRYLIAGLLACLIHGIALSYTPQKNTINVSTDEGSQSLQIQLMTIAASKSGESKIEKSTAKEPKLVTEPPAQKPSIAKPPTPQVSKPISKPIEKKQVLAAKKSKPEPAKKVRANKDVQPQVTKTKVPVKPEPVVSSNEENNTTVEEPTKIETAKVEVTKQTASEKISTQISKPMLVTKPRFSAKPTPVSYPKIARKRGLEGKVLIEVWLDEQGNQTKQLLIKSSGHSVLDKRALNTIKEWRFSHQTDQGQAIAHRVQIPINFQLQ